MATAELTKAKTADRARRIADAIEEGRRGWPMGATYCVEVRAGCAACDPGACTECGHLFTGEIYTIQHVTLGKRVLCDRTVHYLSHGIKEYETGYIIQGKPVIVDIDLDELGAYVGS